MSHRNSKQDRNVRMYKTLAQTIGVVACLFFLLFFIREDGQEMLKDGGNGLVSFLPFIIIPIAGFVLTWFKELAGVLLLSAGGVALIVYFILKGDTGTALLYGLPFIITGVLFLLHLKKRSELQHEHHPHHHK